MLFIGRFYTFGGSKVINLAIDSLGPLHKHKQGVNANYSKKDELQESHFRGLRLNLYTERLVHVSGKLNFKV